MQRQLGIDVHCSGGALHADELAASRNRRELHIIGEVERCEGEGLRVLVSRIRARHEQAFEAVTFKVRDRRRFGHHW